MITYKLISFNCLSYYKVVSNYCRRIVWGHCLMFTCTIFNIFSAVISTTTMMAVPGSVSGIGNKFFESSCTTQFDNTVFRYTWTINDYKIYYNLSSGISSPIFSDFTPDGIKWCLQHKSTYEYEESEIMCICLVLLSAKFTAFKTFCEFSILDAKLNPIHQHTAIKTFTDIDTRLYINLIENSTLFDKSNIYLPNNSLTLLCKITILGEIQDFMNEHPQGFPKDLLLALFEDSKFCDLTLSAGGRELYAHKAILAARSTVFSAMLEHDMKESRTNLIEIDDLDYEVVEEMLRFIYTNKVSNVDKIAHNLFIAADKYALDELRYKCQEAMIKNLSIKNAAQYYLVADQHNAEELKIRVKAFIESNSAKVVKTSGFHLAFQVNPELFINLHLLELR